MAVPITLDCENGVVDISTLSMPEADNVDVDLKESGAQAVVITNFHLLRAATVSIGGNLSFALSQPIELQSTLVEYSGPVLHRMVLPAGLRALTIIETPKSVILSEISVPETVVDLKISLTEAFSPVDEMILPPQLESLTIGGEHNCSLELLHLPPSLTHLNTGSSVQPVDMLQSETLENLTVVSASTRLVERGDDKGATVSTFGNQHATLTPSSALLHGLHETLPGIAHASVILDDTMWRSVGSVWCKTLLEGRLRVHTLHVVNNTDRNCMHDVGEVFYRMARVGRPICTQLQIVGERFDYATSLRVAEAVRKHASDIKLNIRYSAARELPDFCLHRLAGILGCTNRDAHLEYHSRDVVLAYDREKRTLSFAKKAIEPTPPPCQINLNQTQASPWDPNQESEKHDNPLENGRGAVESQPRHDALPSNNPAAQSNPLP